jgi:hypothetical protein
MKPPTNQWISQLMAALVVAVSLGLVAYELKQSRDIAATELTLSTQARDAEQSLFLVRPEIYASAREKLLDGAEPSELTTEEHFAYWTIVDVRRQIFDSIHLLYTKGLVVEGEWEQTRGYLKHMIQHDPFWTEVVDPETYYGRPEMLAELREIWAEIEAENPEFRRPKLRQKRKAEADNMKAATGG